MSVVRVFLDYIAEKERRIYELEDEIRRLNVRLRGDALGAALQAAGPEAIANAMFPVPVVRRGPTFRSDHGGTAFVNGRQVPMETTDLSNNQEADNVPRSKTKPSILREATHLFGDYTTITTTREPEPRRPQRVGDVTTITAAGRTVQIKASPAGRTAKVIVDGVEVVSK